MKPSLEFMEEHAELAAAAIKGRRVLGNVPPKVPVGYRTVDSVLVWDRC